MIKNKQSNASSQGIATIHQTALKKRANKLSIQTINSVRAI